MEFKTLLGLPVEANASEYATDIRFHIRFLMSQPMGFRISVAFIFLFINFLQRQDVLEAGAARNALVWIKVHIAGLIFLQSTFGKEGC